MSFQEAYDNFGLINFIISRNDQIKKIITIIAACVLITLIVYLENSEDVLISQSYAAVATENQTIDCDNPINTLETNACASISLEAVQIELTKYLKASFKHNSYDPQLIESIKKAQINWEAYKASHCDSIFTQWREGTISGVMHTSCEIELTKQRTHDIWMNFLTYMDNSPPALPEPK
ncbi:MAG: DUF1311 domain-containing protein [Glaciecola sp.]|nr:DUF1311 domain-containing protein [Glaciecola sp.]